MQNYKPFDEVYKGNESALEVAGEFLRKRIQYLDIREWVQTSDLYVNEIGDIFYVDFYKHHEQIEEGHGMHDVGWDEPEAYHPFLTKKEFDMKVAEYDASFDDEAADDLKPWQWIVVLSLLVVAVWAIMWIVIPQ